MGTVTITLDGQPASIVAIPVSVNSDGTFSYIIQLDGTEDDNGMVYAIAFDQEGQPSNLRETLVHQIGT